MGEIDCQFVCWIARDRDNQALMRTLIAVVRKFEFLVTAESATTSEDAAFLVAKGIDYLQVFPLGAPSRSTMGV